MSMMALERHSISDQNYRNGILAALRSVGWSNERKVATNSKLKISGELANVGLVVWFGNMHSIHEYIMALELLYHRNQLTSGIIVTATKNEAVRRFWRNKSEVGTSTGNYCEVDTLIDHVETLNDIINIPLTVFAIEE
tara:strand:- start:1184 stop:1597 length:414 start_codon:yes stop_codon:yes gene_type:complete